jgi:hypothetical protein
MLPHIYKVTNNINGKVYIGQTINDYGKGHGVLINRAYKKYGKENFTYDILLFCEIDDLDYYEIKSISIYKSLAEQGNGYNLDHGGNKNKKVSSLTRKKQSLSQKNKIPWNKGLKLNEEKYSIAGKKNKGRTPWNKNKTNIYSEKTIERMIQSAKDRNPYTEEYKTKMSDKISKLKWWNDGVSNTRSEIRPEGNDWVSGRVKRTL